MEALVVPDPTMGDELLTKTGSGNLFMVVGEPAFDVLGVGEDQLQKVVGSA